MIVKTYFVSVAEALAAGRQPRALLARPPGNDDPATSAFGHNAPVGTYEIAAGPLNVEPVAWSVCRHGPVVPVPLFAYVAPAERLAAAALELGFRAGVFLIRDRKAKPRELVLVLGEEAHPVEEGVRFYAGLAVRTE